jgi:hypothetical protein
MSTNRQWQRHAACRDTTWEWIDPTPADVEQCRAVCAVCPVRQSCLTTALTNAEPWGIWGGTDPAERATLAAGLGLPVPRVFPRHGTHTRYARHHCRCVFCRRAHTEYARAHRTHRHQPT